MPARRVRSLPFAVVVVLVTTFFSFGTGSPAGAAVGPSRPSLTGELLYVANADAGPVTAYASASAGRVTPARLVVDPGVVGTAWAPWGVAFDAARNLYVQTFSSDATTFVFPARAGASTRPSRIFRVNGPGSRAIAVDAAGFAYVATGQGGTEIDVAAPRAAGSPGNDFTVPPVRQISTDESAYSPWPGGLTVGLPGQVIAAVLRGTGNALEVFAGGAAGPATPLRVIAGPHTGLGSCAGYGACDQVSLTYSPLTGRIYAAVTQAEQTHISVFAGDASGDAAPLRTIAGPATSLAGKVITGIADSQLDGTIYAMVKSAEFDSPGVVTSFDRLAAGNAAPRRTFTDATTGFRNAGGIALTTG